MRKLDCELPKVVSAAIERNTLPGRAPWMVTLELSNGSKQYSWHRTVVEAKDSCRRMHNIRISRINHARI
jgi:hypothetical protein